MNNHFAGGLAELVLHPTKITFSFFKHWFSGSESLGRGFSLLNLPHLDVNQSVLNLSDGRLVVNLDIEEKIYYSNTIFCYLKQKNINDDPKLVISPKKLINPLNFKDTLKLIFVQSSWIANPEKVRSLSTKLIEEISSLKSSDDVVEVDSILSKKIWPAVIAIGILSEYFYQYLKKTSGDNFANIETYLTGELSNKDWFIRSIRDQLSVKNGTQGLTEYLKEYGIRSDNDYELTSPRWHEDEEKIKKRILGTAWTDSKVSPALNPGKSPKEIELINCLVNLQLNRSESRKYALIWLDLLRAGIVKRVKKIPDLENLTRGKILFNQDENLNSFIFSTEHEDFKKNSRSDKSGSGTAVSTGVATGKAKLVESNLEKIEVNTIGIFPNASVEFSSQFPKCAGIIFLRGGQTSHGSIVAREFKVPALIDPEAQNIQSGVHIEINGTTGLWKLK